MGKSLNQLTKIILLTFLMSVVGCGSQPSTEPLDSEANLIVDSGSKEYEAIPSHDRCYDGVIRQIKATAMISDDISSSVQAGLGYSGYIEPLTIRGHGRVQFINNGKCDNFILTVDEIWNDVHAEIQIGDRIINVEWFSLDTQDWIVGYRFNNSISFIDFANQMATIRIIYIPTNEVLDSKDFDILLASLPTGTSNSANVF